VNASEQRGRWKGMRRLGRWTFLMVGCLVLASVVASTSLAVRAGLGRSSAGLVAVPDRVDLDERLYSTGEVALSKFRITNPLKKPVRVDAIHSACSCTVVPREAALQSGTTIEPGGSQDLWISTTVRPGRDAAQEFATDVLASSEGRSLPPLRLAVSMRIKDPLKAYPQGIRIADVPAGQPLRKTIVLFTRNGKIDPSELTLVSSDERSVRGTLSPASTSQMDQFAGGFVTHYKIEVTVAPIEPGRSISATLGVMDGSQTLLSLPIICTADQPYRLSEDRIELEGRAGEIVSRSLYFEANDRAWRGLRAGQCPEGLTLALEPFDERTTVIRVKARVPEQAPERPWTLSLLAGDGKREVVIPVAIHGEKDPK
jgi:hypothetical protein